MGILETIEGKMDTLIAALNENTKVRQAAGEGAATTAAAATEKAPAKRAAKKEEAPVNKIDEATLVAKFEQLKAKGGDIIVHLKKVIAETGGVASLAELRQLPAKFDAVYEALVALETPADADDDL